MTDHALRSRIADAVTAALRPHPAVLAGWEGGSAAFGKVDSYSDIDLEFLVTDAAQFEELYASAERALEAVSPITARYAPRLGRYYQLKDAGEFLLVDLVLLRVGDADRHHEIERHGEKVPFFDKGGWLAPVPVDQAALTAKREQRLNELRAWFPMSQVFVRKAMLRGQQIEAINAYWICTLRPLVDLLRMRHCPVRWDFGVRYLERDLPSEVYEELQRLTFVAEPDDLPDKLARATTWATALLHDLQKA